MRFLISRTRLPCHSSEKPSEYSFLDEIGTDIGQVKTYVVVIDSLEDLMKFVSEYGKIVLDYDTYVYSKEDGTFIIGYLSEPMPSIEIYDGYRE